MTEATCSVPECDKPRGRSRGTLCEMHYYRMYRGGTLEKRRQKRTCTTCGDPAFGHGLCRRHYMQQRRADPTRPRCGEDGCTRAVDSRGLCGYHYTVKYLPEFVARERQSPARRAAVREWQKNNPHRMSILRRNRRNRMRAQSAGVPVTKADLQAVLDEFGMVCHICGEAIKDRTDLHFDHVVPLSRGGAHSVDNIRPAHARCNQRKGARLSA